MKVIFLDRDGVINKERHYLYKIEDFVFIDGVFRACLSFQKLGFKIIIITNQSGIAKGIYTIDDFEKLNAWVLAKFRENGVDILDVFYCPHDDDNTCECRKPRAGMLLSAEKKHAITLQESVMIGDKENDITAANLAGIKNTVLVRSGHKIDEAHSKARFILHSIKQVPAILSQF